MSLQPEKSSALPPCAPHPAAPNPGEFSQDERRQLLQLAHDAIAAAIDNREISLEAPSEHLAERRGVFTTLYLHKELRGCVGYVFAVMPLYRAVAETAKASAFEDARFWPVTKEEAPHLRVSLSVLSRLQPIRPEEIEIGKHGLVVSSGDRRGLLLPQVPVEHHWGRETFLEQTCRKAGLGDDAWRKGALLEAFTAEIFADEGCQL
ncbi:MAG TPA: AmmeMemoRadiSam system protein A [Terriglobales bacterium]|nr:AmmeMemoRadiSam system protein A [Terriglobales bacterium]